MGFRVGLAPILLKKFEKRACNHLFWSPNGQFIVLAGVGTNGGKFVPVGENLLKKITFFMHIFNLSIEYY